MSEENISSAKEKTRGQIIAAIIGGIALITVALIGLLGGKSSEKTPNQNSIPTITINNTNSQGIPVESKTIQGIKAEDKICSLIRNRVKGYSKLIQNQLDTVLNRRHKINLLFWKEKFTGYSKYDCNMISNDFDELTNSFEKANKALKIDL